MSGRGRGHAKRQPPGEKIRDDSWMRDYQLTRDLLLAPLAAYREVRVNPELQRVLEREEAAAADALTRRAVDRSPSPVFLPEHSPPCSPPRSPTRG